MDTKSAAKVGIFAIFSAVLFGVIWYFLSHQDVRSNAYLIRVRYDDTKGLSKQSVVRMQGVNIGEVSNIELDTSRPPFQPIVTLAIRKGVNIPDDSRFTIVSGILITTPEVVIVPGIAGRFLATDNTATAIGDKPGTTLAALSPELQESVTEMRSSVKTLTTKLGTTLDKVNKTLDQTTPILKHTDELIVTTRDTATSAKRLIEEPQLRTELKATLKNFRLVSEDARTTSKELTGFVRDLTKNTKGPIEKLPITLNDLLSKIDETLENADAVVQKLTEQVTDPRLQQSLQETTELARTTLARFNQIASDLHELTGDPKLQSDVKLTVENLRSTTEKSQQIVERFNNLLGKLVGTDGEVRPKISLPNVDIVTNVSEQVSPSRFRLDINAHLRYNNRDEAIFGLYDLGQNTRLNFQIATPVNQQLRWRYGLYASRLGTGVDYTPNQNLQFRADLWDTNRPRLDFRGSFRVNSSAAVWVGADSLLRRPVPIFGVEYKH